MPLGFPFPGFHLRHVTLSRLAGLATLPCPSLAGSESRWQPLRSHRGRQPAGGEGERATAPPPPIDILTLLFSIWMAMTPIPVRILVTPPRFRVLDMIPVVVGKIHSPGLVLVVIPVMVVLVVPIVDPDLNGGALGAGNSHN